MTQDLFLSVIRVDTLKKYYTEGTHSARVSLSKWLIIIVNLQNFNIIFKLPNGHEMKVRKIVAVMIFLTFISIHRRSINFN